MAVRGVAVSVFAAIACMLAGSADVGATEVNSFRRPANPTAPAFAFNPTTDEKVGLGRRLFFDTRLSASNTSSCATCHEERFGWSDRRRFSLNDSGAEMSRRTQTLIGVGWVTNLGWDGGVPTLEGFALAPIARAHEMSQDLDDLVLELRASKAYADDMTAAFGSAAVSIDRISHALAAFMRSLVPEQTPFDRWLAGDAQAISDSAQQGFRLFTGKARCAACHTGWRFTDDAFHDIGLPAGRDLGRAKLAAGDPAMRYAFKTPTLLGVAMHPPYMHDGSLPDLAAVVEHYNDGIRHRLSLSPLLRPVELSDREKLNVIDFLNTLSADN